jgi:UMF1 family MFS transporter
MQLNDKRIINGWAMYDWANSVYFLVISTAIFPAYYMAVTFETIDIGNLSLSNSSLYSFSVAFSYCILVLLSPILAGIADYGGNRMLFLKFFTYLGSLACIGLSFFGGPDDLWIGLSGFILATIGAAGGLVFYNAYLPEIATEDQYDNISARGYAFGYIGSVLLLVAILVLSLKPTLFGIPEATNLPYQFGFTLVGLWWMGFAQITFHRLPKTPGKGVNLTMFKKGNEEILKVFRQLLKNANLMRFLLAVLFYNAGVQTVIYLATVFAKQELKFDTSELIVIILILQLVAIGGAYLFAWVSRWQGNKRSLIYMVIIWIIITLLAYFVYNKAQFYLIAALVGLVMGGIQSLSRSSYSKLVDEYRKDLTSYFSFYDIVFKLSIIIGTFLFGLVNQLMGGLRPSVLALAVLFVIGLVLLFTVRFDLDKPATDHRINS